MAGDLVRSRFRPAVNHPRVAGARRAHRLAEHDFSKNDFPDFDSLTCWPASDASQSPYTPSVFLPISSCVSGCPRHKYERSKKFKAKARMKPKRKKPAKRSIKAPSLSVRGSRKRKVPKGGGKPKGRGNSKGEGKVKIALVSQLQAVVVSGKLTVHQVDGGSVLLDGTAVPLPAPHAVQPGDEFAGDHASAHEYRLKDTANSNTDVVTVTGDGSASCDVVEIPDVSFFTSVDSYYDEDGQTVFVLDGSDGVIGIRG